MDAPTGTFKTQRQRDRFTLMFFKDAHGMNFIILLRLKEHHIGPSTISRLKKKKWSYPPVVDLNKILRYVPA